MNASPLADPLADPALAARLEAARVTVERVHTEVGNGIDSVPDGASTAWHSPAQREYATGLESLRAHLAGAVRHLGDLAQLLAEAATGVARAIADAELAAKEAARAASESGAQSGGGGGGLSEPGETWAPAGPAPSGGDAWDGPGGLGEVPRDHGGCTL
jgi:hypothetical protein